MKTLLRNAFLVLILGSFVLSPALASAKNSKDKEDKKQDKIEKRIEKVAQKQEKKEEKIAEKAEKIENKIARKDQVCIPPFFVRFLPFGWIKRNWNNINLDQNCLTYSPGPKASSTPDTIAPVISNINTKTGYVRALVTWETNERVTGKIYYSTSSPVDINTAPVILVNKFGLGGREHYAVINGLASSTTYRFVVEAKDKAGNISRSGELSFTTKSNSVPADVTAPIISSINSAVSSSTIDVTWNTNEAATSKVYYSTTTPINTSSANFIQSGAFVTSHNIKIEGLSSSTPYYLFVESADAAVNVATSTPFATTTLAQ